MICICIDWHIYILDILVAANFIAAFWFSINLQYNSINNFSWNFLIVFSCRFGFRIGAPNGEKSMRPKWQQPNENKRSWVMVMAITARPLIRIRRAWTCAIATAHDDDAEQALWAAWLREMDDGQYIYIINYFQIFHIYISSRTKKKNIEQFFEGKKNNWKFINIRIDKEKFDSRLLLYKQTLSTESELYD